MKWRFDWCFCHTRDFCIYDVCSIRLLRQKECFITDGLVVVGLEISVARLASEHCTDTMMSSASFERASRALLQNGVEHDHDSVCVCSHQNGGMENAPMTSCWVRIKLILLQVQVSKGGRGYLLLLMRDYRGWTCFLSATSSSSPGLSMTLVSLSKAVLGFCHLT